MPVYAGSDAGGGIAHGRIVDEIDQAARRRASGRAGRGQLGGAGLAGPARVWTAGAPADLLVYADDPRSPDVLREPQLIMLRGRVIRPG